MLHKPTNSRFVLLIVDRTNLIPSKALKDFMARLGFGTYLCNLESTLMLNLFNLDLLSDVTSYVVQSTKYSQMHREGLFLKLVACLCSTALVTVRWHKNVSNAFGVIRHLQ